MTKQEILAMEPGLELNTKVAEEVMGNKVIKDQNFGEVERLEDPLGGSPIWAPVSPYSEDENTARLVVEAMRDRGYNDADSWASFGDGQFSPAEAICKAALIAIMEGKEVKEASDSILRQAFGDEV